MQLFHEDGTPGTTLWAPNRGGEAMSIDTGRPDEPSMSAQAEWPSEDGFTRDQWLVECCKFALTLWRGRGADYTRAAIYNLEFTMPPRYS